MPLPSVYVKCYAEGKSNSNAYFYRDGYTDFRGKFDYALSSSSDINEISRFSILIVSEDKGSVIKTAKKPNEKGKIISILDDELEF